MSKPLHGKFLMMMMPITVLHSCSSTGPLSDGKTIIKIVNFILMFRYILYIKLMSVL